MKGLAKLSLVLVGLASLSSLAVSNPAQAFDGCGRVGYGRLDRHERIERRIERERRLENRLDGRGISLRQRMRWGW
jgi:hypothetical protein